ncbi:arginine decarboxylase [Spirochaeta thermophila DSM 6578]|uniref:Arginine decarboxylase n=1 Tax=Winmispira thermophila (strain ATCC 700085 / DSM 6578 / Z-1203) TaxID=869211 RepID=G0G9W5_WINT7|nr:biosynthetic arginine decarboxylase [Spirochaeta thermophila]AEJ60865.1 arginine decarboxylase [Spirochaeta thermophila DSM 6578]
MARKEIKAWTIKDSDEYYGISRWGGDFFGISESGEVTVKLSTPERKTEEVSLYEIAQKVVQGGLSFPVLLRFRDILRAKIHELNNAFLSAIKESGYRGTYRGVFPIKVNQQQQVIEDIVEIGRPFHYGLEAGSKAELFIALSHLRDKESLLVCNGYKDREFIDLALYGTKLGHKVVLVIERLSEIRTIIERSRALGILPFLGIRVKLSSTTPGKWSESSGDQSIFGLTSHQVVSAVKILKEEGMLDRLVLLHYHLGSQIPDIRHIRSAVKEAARYYAALYKEGATMGHLDIGGGLAVDYDGSQTNFHSSRNYTLKEYATDVVEEVMEILDPEGIPHPTLVSESGRFVVAYSSVLLFNVLDSSSLTVAPDRLSVPEECSPTLKELIDIYNSISVKNVQEAFHDIIYYRDLIRSQFIMGDIPLWERGLAELYFWNGIEKLVKVSKQLKYIPEEIEEAEASLAHIYYGNFSVFQSLPDAWAIDQLFPIVPIHRLNEQPEVPAIIADTTCDSDGKIDTFIDIYDTRPYLLLHPLKDEEYIIGIFLVGAYQETLGDLHNLFGDTHIVNVALDDDGEIVFVNEVEGDTVEDILSYVEYIPKAILHRLKRKVEQALKEKKIGLPEKKAIMEAFEEGMRGYTYFE